MKILVIKCGGSIIEQLGNSFFESLNELKEDGYTFVFVHGGGPDIDSMLENMNIPVQFVNGLRKTTAKTLAIAELILAGKTNRKLVHMLQKKGFSAVGLNGSDAGILQAEYINQSKLGEVGTITNVNTMLLNTMLNQGICPVITPISLTDHGNKLNVNADTAAGAVAAALGAECCIFITDVEGIRSQNKLVKQVTEEHVKEMIDDGTIYGGMIPKVQAALSARKQGAGRILIAGGINKFFSRGKWRGTLLGQEERVIQ